MRRLLTSYGVHYNRRYGRSGHLFQNRYRSILCEMDQYFLELLRYIHLNPLRAGIVKDLEKLESYPWCGDGVLMGKARNSWQITEEVLAFFDKTERRARLKYQAFVEEGLKYGRRPELVGQGVWRRKSGDEKFRDPRILGDTQFVEEVLKRRSERNEAEVLRRIPWTDLLKWVAMQWGLSPEVIKSGTKQSRVARARSMLSFLAVRKMGMKATEVAKLLGLSQPAVSKSLLRGGEMVKEDPSILGPFQG